MHIKAPLCTGTNAGNENSCFVAIIKPPIEERTTSMPYWVFPHPTKTTAATITISCDFIARELSSRWAQFSRRFNCCRKKLSALKTEGWWLNLKHTSRSARGAIGATSELYSEDDSSYFGLVQIPYDEICWIPFSEVRGKQSVCTNIERDSLAEYRGNLDGLKKRHWKWH